MSKGSLFSVPISAISILLASLVQKYNHFALISARINNAQIIMTCPGFDRSWSYRVGHFNPSTQI